MISKIGTVVGVVSDAFNTLAIGAMYVGDAITGITGTIGAFIAAANPIALVAVAIGAVVAALVVFFTKTKLGKKLWGEFTDFLGNAWSKAKELASSAWDAITDKVSQAADAVKTHGMVLKTGSTASGAESRTRPAQQSRV